MLPISASALASFVTLLVVSTSALPSPLAAPEINPQSIRIQTIHEFPSNYDIENLAVRQSGEILVTVSDHPELYQVNPFTGETVLVATIPAVLGTIDIVELEKDVFYTDVGNVTRPNFTGVQGSFSIYRIDLRNFNPGKPGSAPFTQVISFPEAEFLNGMAVLDKSAGSLLVADSFAGLVWKANIHTGEVSKAIEDPAMKPDPTAAFQVGINGIKIRDHALYFDNYNFGTLSRVPIRPDGTAAGPVTTVATGLTGIDDFQLDARGDVFVAQNLPANELGFVKEDSNSGTVLAPLTGATATQFGRTQADKKTLYITSNAGVAEVDGKNVTVGGKVSKANVGLEGC